MASAILVSIKEEVTCPICLELLTEPLSTDCGHSFCRACITSKSECTTGREGESSCPVCRLSYQLEDLQPNRHVVNIVEKLKEFSMSPEEEQKVALCARHGETLQLFCKEDGKVICWLCEQSREHRGHHTFLLEEVAEEYQEKLQAALEKLMEDKEECEKWKADLKEERNFWKNQIKYEEENVQEVFEQLRNIVDSVEEGELQKLRREEEGILNTLAESEKELVQQSQLVTDLISDLEHQMQGSAMEMLQDVNDIMKRSEILTPKKPETFPREQRRVFQVPDLRGMLQVFQELTDVRRYWVCLKLAPSNNPRVTLSQDQKQIRYDCDWRGNYPFKNKNYPGGVLGLCTITLGKYYWEVDVSKKHVWLLGLYNGRQVQPNSGLNVGQDMTYQPKCGYWVIGLRNGSEYNAFQDCPATCNPLILTLSVTVPPCRVGVFLDCEAGTLSFYNVTHHGFLIYKFSTYSFPDRVFLYFHPMQCSEPMTLCWLSF